MKLILPPHTLSTGELRRKTAQGQRAPKWREHYCIDIHTSLSNLQ
jgi:hypothetical protein